MELSDSSRSQFGASHSWLDLWKARSRGSNTWLCIICVIISWVKGWVKEKSIRSDTGHGTSWVAIEWWRNPLQAFVVYIMHVVSSDLSRYSFGTSNFWRDLEGQVKGREDQLATYQLEEQRPSREMRSVLVEGSAIKSIRSDKVCRCNLVANPNRIPIFDWHVVMWGSKTNTIKTHIFTSDWNTSSKIYEEIHVQ